MKIALIRGNHPSGLVKLFLSLGILILSPSASAECYYPNGTAEMNPNYQPCPQFHGPAKTCCALNRTNPFGGAGSNGWTANKYLPNGLCLAGTTDTDAEGKASLQYRYWRDLCTSQNWDDGGCLTVCIGPGEYQSPDHTVILTPCGDPNTTTTWCCGETHDYYNTSKAIYISPTLQGYMPTPSATPSASPTVEPSNPQSPQPAPVLSTGAKIGIGVGVSVGAIMILINLAWLSLRKREPKTSIKGENGEMRPPHAQAQLPAELNSHFTYEMPTSPRQLAEDLHGDAANRT